MNYRDYNDNELLSYIAEENEEASEILFHKYEPFIVKQAKKMYPYGKTLGLEMSDLMQEGRLGLNLAIHHFQEQKDNSFFTFAKTCIERKMLSALVGAKRQKHRILNESLSLESTVDAEHIFELQSLLEDKEANPEAQLLNVEHENQLIYQIKGILTDYENQVFELKLSNFNYKEIAQILDKNPKAIDNALQRIRQKIKKKLNLE